ncbi:MAG TPA: cation diffusion facilitator family transporter [Nitrososphaeraceae archaeon]|nr:cation diffusion facilitator family transporter [Nitrososphaeraceae archaeon]
MDSHYAVDANNQSIVSSLTALEKKILKNLEQFKRNKLGLAKGRSRNIVNNGLIAGQKIAKVSIITLLGIGIAELLVGYWGGSIVAIADGIDSFSGAMISFIVLLGLRTAHRPPNVKFQYGYHKVESFAALMASIGMIVIGSVVLINSYQSLVHPHEVKHPLITMIVLAAAGIISLHRAYQMRKLAKKYNLLSLKTDAKNSIKDGIASIIGFISVVVATQFGFLQMDAIGGMFIALYILSVSSMFLRKSTSVLIDFCEDSNLSDRMRKLIVERFGDEIINVKSILIRPTGMLMHVEVNVEIDGTKKFGEVDLLLSDMEMTIRSKFSNIVSLTIIPHSSQKNYRHYQKQCLSQEIKIM